MLSVTGNREMHQQVVGAGTFLLFNGWDLSYVPSKEWPLGFYQQKLVSEGL